MSLLLLLNGKGETSTTGSFLRVREPVPMRQYLLATTPSGRTHRWGEDEPGADQVFSDLADSSSAPGGCKELACSLPRKPGVDYRDMVRGTKVELFGAGRRRLWQGRLQQAPRSSGDRLVMDPSAVGYQAHLSDYEGAQCIPIDADINAWGEPSTARRKQLIENGIRLMAATSVGLSSKDPEAVVASIINDFTNVVSVAADTEAGESHYDSSGVDIGEVLYDFLGDLAGGAESAVWENTLMLGASDTLFTISGADHNAVAASQQSVIGGEGIQHARIRDRLNESEGISLKRIFAWQPKVIGNHDIPLQGTWPDVGVLASDVIAFALAQWAPLINFSTGTAGTLRPSTFPIPHLPFKEATTVKRIVEAALRFELLEWGVWPDPRGRPTYYLNPRGTREGRKRWRVRGKQAQLKETGPSMERACNGVFVEYRDVDGTTKLIGPPGSGAPQTSADLIDLDPENPINQIPGLKKCPKIVLKDMSTNLGAIERGKRYIEQTKLLDSSGEATLTGLIEDEHGILWPYYCAEGGDELDCLDGRGYRYMVEAQRSRSARGTNVHLDAPPNSEEALQERLNVEILAGLGV